MVSKNLKGKTPLTEPQAKSLADWWGGAYHKTIVPSAQGVQAMHGVMIACGHHPDAEGSSSSGGSLWSLEEVRELENLRSAINPAAADWVG
jgi:hypothetical protein